MLIPPTDVSVFCRVRNLWDKMSDCASAYSELREKVIEGAEEHLNEQHLKYFISQFQSIINSKRRSSYIRNFRHLVTLLEKRGYIGEANVERFAQIVNLLPNSGFLEETIYNYRHYMDRNGLQGPYVNDERAAFSLSSQNNSTGSGRSRSSDAVFSRNSVLPEAALDCVCKDIGTHWKDLARNLSMREGDIDEIEEKYPGKLRERAYECMRRFMKGTDPYKVQQKLLHALDKCGRRDIKEEVEEILNRRPH